MQHNIDIIIPVFNGYNYLNQCLKSVMESLEYNESKITVNIIDVGSTDEQINILIDSYVFASPFFKKYTNVTNNGFVKTINSGLLLSTNDVIILNSDTLVYGNWVDKLLLQLLR